jgi:hypothetical protein
MGFNLLASALNISSSDAAASVKALFANLPPT